MHSNDTMSGAAKESDVIEGKSARGFLAGGLMLLAANADSEVVSETVEYEVDGQTFAGVL